MAVWRDTGQRDRFGQRVQQVVPTERGVEGMAPTIDKIRCRCTVGAGGQRFEERSSLVFVTYHTVFCDPNADVRESDRVQVVERSQGRVIVPDGAVTLVVPAYAMEVVHHLEVKLEVVRGPSSGGFTP